MRTRSNGSETHRLKPMQEYDPKVFNEIYRVVLPVIRNLSRHIDHRRYNVTSDLIQSYFMDKALFVFNKYYGTCSNEHLKAKVLASLSTYKNKLLRYAYGEIAEYNQSLASFDYLYDSNKGDFSWNAEEELAKGEMMDMVKKYMRQHLSPDGLLIFEAIIAPPPFIKEQLNKDNSRVTNLLLLEFFDLPRTRTSLKYIASIRDDVNYWINRAKSDLTY